VLDIDPQLSFFSCGWKFGDFSCLAGRPGGLAKGKGWETCARELVDVRELKMQGMALFSLSLFFSQRLVFDDFLLLYVCLALFPLLLFV